MRSGHLYSMAGLLFGGRHEHAKIYARVVDVAFGPCQDRACQVIEVWPRSLRGEQE